MKLGVVVQARMGSKRLPGKVLADVGGKTVIARVLERVSRIKGVGPVIVAIPNAPGNLSLWREIFDLNYDCRSISANEDDVLARYYEVASEYKLDTIVRITADCPLLDPEVSTRVIQGYLKGDYDYYSNVHPATFPDGLDTEVFSQPALCKAWAHAKGYEREHVTPYIWKRPYRFRMGNLMYPKDLSHHRWTLDTEEDLEFIRRVYAHFGDNPFGMDDILALPFSRTLTRTTPL